MQSYLYFTHMHSTFLEQTDAQKGHCKYTVSMGFTSFLSRRLVNMTMVADLCSQTILQKSAAVSGFGPANRQGKPNLFYIYIKKKILTECIDINGATESKR